MDSDVAAITWPRTRPVVCIPPFARTKFKKQNRKVDYSGQAAGAVKSHLVRREREQQGIAEPERDLWQRHTKQGG